MIIDLQQYSAFSFLPMVALALVSILQSIFYVMYPVPATGTRFPWIAYQLSAITNLLAPKPTPKLSSNPNPNPSSFKKTPLAYQSFYFLKLFNQTAHEIIL